MTEPTQRQVDAELEKSMDLFERADVGSVDTIDGKRPDRVLVVLDGSSQDHALVLLARQLYERLDCKIGVVVITAEQSELDSSDRQILGDMQIEEIKPKSAEEANYDQILAASEAFGADLLMAPCPFGRDFESLGEDSTGTVIDVLTARSHVPIIAIRRPDATGRDPTSHLRIILTGENRAASAAARWAVGLVQPAGRLELLLLVEASFYENFREVMHSIQPGATFDYEDLENALAKHYTQLHGSLHQSAAAVGFTYELLVRYEKDEELITPEDPKSHPALMVLALKRGDHDSQAEVGDFLRRSPHPVLIVSVD